MQKYIVIEVEPSDGDKLNEVNLLLEQGWGIVREEINKPRDGRGFHLLVRMEKNIEVGEEISNVIERINAEKIEKQKECKQQIINALKDLNIYSDEIGNIISSTLSEL